MYFLAIKIGEATLAASRAFGGKSCAITKPEGMSVIYFTMRLPSCVTLSVVEGFRVTTPGSRALEVWLSVIQIHGNTFSLLVQVAH